MINIRLKNGKFPCDARYNSVILRLCISKEFDQSLDFLAEMHLEKLKTSEISYDVLWIIWREKEISGRGPWNMITPITFAATGLRIATTQ